MSLSFSQSDETAGTQEDLVDVMARLSQAYAKQKISRPSYRRQRKALLDFREGKAKRLPEFCFNELSQHQDASRPRGLSKHSSQPGHSAQPGGLRPLPALLCLACGAVVGLLLILAMGTS